MRYAVLTAKHVSGHCLWPSAHTDYHVGTSANTTDVVAAFVAACRQYGIVPGLYYCSWDNYHTLGSLTPDNRVDGGDQMGKTIWNRAFTTAEYRAFQLAQIEELCTTYGPLGEVWIDIPHLLTADGRCKQYAQIASLGPDAVVMMNTGFRDGMLGQGQDGSTLDAAFVWPTDLVSMETSLPTTYGYNPWFKLGLLTGDTRDYYIPGEVVECISAGGSGFRATATHYAATRNCSVCAFSRRRVRLISC